MTEHNLFRLMCDLAAAPWHPPIRFTKFQRKRLKFSHRLDFQIKTSFSYLMHMSFQNVIFYRSWHHWVCALWCHVNKSGRSCYFLRITGNRLLLFSDQEHSAASFFRFSYRIASCVAFEVFSIRHAQRGKWRENKTTERVVVTHSDIYDRNWMLILKI